MAVSEEQVRRIAELARLRPEGEALERLTGELNGILEQVRRLEELDVSGLAEAGHGAGDSIAYRDDALEPDRLARSAPGDRAPDWRDGFFVVPRLPALGDGDVDDGGVE